MFETKLNTTFTFHDQVKCIFDNLHSILNKHAPKVRKSKRISSKPLTHPNITQARRKKRKAERKYIKTGRESDKKTLCNETKNLAHTIKCTQNDYFSNKLNKVKKDPKATYKIINYLLNKTEEKILPEHSNPKNLANDFEEFFYKKVMDIRKNIESKTSSSKSIMEDYLK